MNKPLILVVEDDPSVRNLITSTLKTNDYGRDPCLRADGRGTSESGRELEPRSGGEEQCWPRVHRRGSGADAADGRI